MLPWAKLARVVMARIRLGEATASQPASCVCVSFFFSAAAAAGAKVMNEQPAGGGATIRSRRRDANLHPVAATTGERGARDVNLEKILLLSAPLAGSRRAVVGEIPPLLCSRAACRSSASLPAPHRAT